jgi:hypothetical protein
LRLSCKIQAFLFWLALWGIALLLTACGGERESAEETAPAPSPTALSAATNTVQPPPVAPVAARTTPGAQQAPPEAAEQMSAAAMTVTLAATVSLTSEVISPTANQAITSLALLTNVVNDISLCPIKLDLDLSTYPDLNGLVQGLGCPVAEASSTPIAINEFGAGPDYDRFMLWFSAEQQIYVLFADFTWLGYSDHWVEGMPEISCSPDGVAQASPPLPRRGFGKLWCEVDSVRQHMGLIEREERLCQHSVGQRLERGRFVACFEDATIRYFRIYDNGLWDVRLVR